MTFKDKLIEAVKYEIDSLDELIEILNGGDEILQIDDEINKNKDIEIMKHRRSNWMDFKSLIIKLNSEIPDVEHVLTIEEKRIFYRFIKIVSWFRRVFNFKKWFK